MECTTDLHHCIANMIGTEPNGTDGEGAPLDVFDAGDNVKVVGAAFTADGKQLVTTVDAAPDPSRIGTKQPRGVRFENGLMILVPPPELDRA